jgi:hypothetical protein
MPPLTTSRDEHPRPSTPKAGESVYGEQGGPAGTVSPNQILYFCTISDTEQEFSNLADDANVYKLVGPVLLKQDTTEAKSTVESRLEYIEKEM